jgi:hypothetical protein
VVDSIRILVDYAPDSEKSSCITIVTRQDRLSVLERAVLAAVAKHYKSVTLLACSCIFLVTTHLFVIAYEEPALERKFGSDYIDYRRNVHRWLSRFRA